MFGEVEGKMGNTTECMGCRECQGAVQDIGCILRTNGDLIRDEQLGPQHEARVWESVKCLGKMQLLQPGPVYTCPKREGGRRTSQNAMQPASGQSQPEGKEV